MGLSTGQILGNNPMVQSKNYKHCAEASTIHRHGFAPMPPSGLSVGSGACSENPARHEGASLCAPGPDRPSSPLLSFVLLPGAACSGAAALQPTNQPGEVSAPTVDPQTRQIIDKILELSDRVESLERQFASSAAPLNEPEYWPTYADFAVVALPNPGGLTPVLRDSIKSRFLAYVSVYIADACVSGRVRSVAGFSAFLRQPESSMVARAQTIVSQMLGQSPEVIKSTCIGSYMYPETTAQLALATDFAATVAYYSIAQFFRGGFIRVTVGDRASVWFGESGVRSQSLLLEILSDLAPAAKSGETVMPSEGPLNPPMDWVLELKVREIARCADTTRTIPGC